AYISHLVRAKELLAYTLISIHNVTELIRFTQRIREAILNHRFVEEFQFWLSPAPDSETVLDEIEINKRSHG
ncbi:MAG: hypothetical protein ACKPGD_13455, partial [Planktothrix sp.]